MHFHILTLAAILSLTTALPTTTGDDTHCAPGTTFYHCKTNNFRGCCTIDPCALPSCPSQTAPSILPTPPTCPGTVQIYQPKTQTHLSGSGSTISTPNFNLTKSPTREWTQTITFSVPKSATECALRWSVPAKRTFQAGDNAVVHVSQGHPATGREIGTADFTNWPGVDGPHKHSVAKVDCMPEMVFGLRLAAESEIFLAQDGQTGWFVEYSC
ncbi:hypothetical protein BDV28DRAFT_144784 [Aspergillus coremiiformis]|uniref:Ubiquitin 3 binding protein But2 C-terminal domain-containing protein n=1 Tax=Aspergillus coremiiformis TaxID=138285 RepID=A0A5N6ZGW6_9EURO|nr:hypothetical protein BDV28DRAFT_144784 [Aspergillus coremiiformis]